MTTNYNKYSIYNINEYGYKKSQLSNVEKKRRKRVKNKKRKKKKKFPDKRSFISETGKTIHFKIHSGSISNSPREQKIESTLIGKEVYFTREISIQGLNNKETGNPLRFDFIIIRYGGALLIEYDGIHHEECLVTMERDRQKNEFCKKQGIRLVRINRKNYKNRGIIIGGGLGHLKRKMKKMMT